jgi:hypothetical protein
MYSSFKQKPRGKKPSARARRKWKFNIEILRELTQCRTHLIAFTIVIVNDRIDQ